MAGYYVPSSFSANYVSNKKSDSGDYIYDSATNRAGVDAQRNLQQLNKQYNVTINNAYAQHLLANQGLKASTLGTGYKDAYVQRLQESVNSEIDQANVSVQNVKQNIFATLNQNLQGISAIQQQEVNNMRRMAGSLEQYNNYLNTLSAKEGNTRYVEDQKFKLGDEWTFEDNYDKLFGTQQFVLSNYLDENGSDGLAYTEWLRNNSGTSEDDTAWLDWLYTNGLTQYQDFIKNGVNGGYDPIIQKPKPGSATPAPTTTPTEKLSLWELYRKYSTGSAS